MFSLKCRRNYAISAEYISISQSNIVLIVSAVINLIFSDCRPFLQEPSHLAGVNMGLFAFKEKAFFFAAVWFTETGSRKISSVFGFVISHLCNFKYNTLTLDATVCNGGGFHCLMDMWRSVMSSSMTPNALSEQHEINAGKPAHHSPSLGNSHRARLWRCKIQAHVGVLQTIQNTWLWTSCSVALCSRRYFYRVSLQLLA